MKVTTVPIPVPKLDVSITMSHEDATYLLMICGRVGGTPRNPVRKMTNALSEALRGKAGIHYFIEDSHRLIDSGTTLQCTEETRGVA